MTPEVEAEYQQVLTRVVLKHGSLVVERPSIYEWKDHESTWSGEPPHLSICEVVKAGRVMESSWTEFQGTFYEGDERVHGVQLFGVTCACRHIKNRELRWSASVQEVARAVFEELYRTTRLAPSAD